MRKLLYLVAALSLLFSQLVMAAGPEFRKDMPQHYTVVKGDTLWGISSRFLKNPWYWPEIWHANPQINDPNLIYPGDELALVYINGKPMLTKVKNGSNSGVIKLSPKIRSTPLETPVPTIPLEDIQGFLSGTRIVAKDVLEKAPYVLQGEDGRIASGAGDIVYARGDGKGQKVFGVYREGKAYYDPITHEFLGLEAKSLGQGKVTAVNGQVMTLFLQKSNEEVMAGDRLLPTEDKPIRPNFQPSAPDTDIHGYMISVLNGVSQIGQYDVVVLNKGKRDGLKVGNVLAVFKKGQITRDPYTKELVQLPSERAGLLMVFRTFDKVSYGLVLQATRPLSVGDEVRNP
ncbi:LysM peptidoglycan-binding domain-containing protein [Mangrovitalea sediminis]|uniref:LysM peptidoglycan-binding domain-containing protein n=1 Tax=Mangrovitalea sediminis TaxID=1982043 RepID=UPI000BE57189|nr:LysM domain-containing protein [Mangrovitalea sediminis]